MPNIKTELIDLMNRALALEHAARIQYLAHAELITGLNAEPIIARLKEIASDEEKHEEKFRSMISDYLDGEPTMSIGPVYPAKGILPILEQNRKIEKEGHDLYKQIYRTLVDHKSELQYEFEQLEHELRHIILDEQEHIMELTRLIEPAS